MGYRRFLSLEGAHALSLRRLLPKRVELSSPYAQPIR
jgi:hypothetical protein